MSQATADPPGSDPIAELEERALNTLGANRARPYYDADKDERDRDDYYADLDWDAPPEDVLSALRQLLEASHVRHLHYAPSEQLYPWVDLHPDGHLYNIYSGLRVDPEDVIRGDARIARQRQARITAAMRLRHSMSADETRALVDAVEGELPFNCEHVVPQAWFDRKQPMRGDLHHLFACEPDCNNKRAAIPYAELLDSKPIVTECGRASADGSGFEPLVGKGAVARATLYFLVRYPDAIAHQVSEPRHASSQTLLAWHRGDSPTDYERHRNAAIRDVQGNRNPFIDFPGTTGRIDFAGMYESMIKGDDGSGEPSRAVRR